MATMDHRKVLLERRESYGLVRCYPANETAILICKLAGRTCLTKGCMEILKKLGYEVEFLPWEPKE